MPTPPTFKLFLSYVVKHHLTSRIPTWCRVWCRVGVGFGVGFLSVGVGYVGFDGIHLCFNKKRDTNVRKLDIVCVSVRR